MKQVVYVDVLVALNMILSFFLIRSVCVFARERPSTLRVLVGSALGGIYALVIFLPEVHIFLNLVGRFVFLLLVAFCVFGFGSVRRFCRCFVLLFAVSMLFAGAVLALHLLVLPNGTVVRNGSFYADIGFIQLVLSCALVYAVSRIFGSFFTKRSSEEINVRVKLSFGGKTVCADGIIDTGNTLNDSFTGEPVNIISQSLALGLLPDSCAGAVISPLSGNIPAGMHLVVSDTVGASALMCAFKADSMTLTVYDKKVSVTGATLAVSGRETFAGSKNVLVNSVFINDITGGRDSGKTDKTHKPNKTKAEKARCLLHKRSRNSASSADGCAGKRGDAAH